MTAPSQDQATAAAASSPSPAPAAPARPAPAAIAKALTRYRTLAYIVGVVLVTLVLVAVPLKYAADTPQLVQTIGPIHGVLYIVYLLVTFDLATKTRLPFRRTILVMLAGTIPFVSFIAERSVTREVRARLAADTSPAPQA
jgi:integral membrane protein